MSNNNESTARPNIVEGWTLKIIDHDYLNDSRDNVTVTHVSDDGATLQPRRPWSSQGMRFRTMDVSWARLEWEGNTARLWTVPKSTTSRSTAGVPRLVKTFEFAPPRT